jgi:glycosyltransferase involved in cell wall biosynthesis
MQKKKILISSFDMAIGGVERSLIGLLSSIDYNKYDVDLMLFKHEGEFFPYLPIHPHLLKEIEVYTTFRKSVKEILRERNFPITVTRLLAKYLGLLNGKLIKSEEPGYMIIQYGWKLSLPFLPKLEENYDVAVSFLWPHYFISDKISADRKIGWIHTDYKNITVNKSLEKQMWREIDNIVAVSDGCRDSFIEEFPTLINKVSVIENIISPEFIYEQSKEDITYGVTPKPGRTTLVTVGRLSHAKGLDNAIRACRLLVDEGLEIEWYVVGYGPLEDELKQLINDLNLQERFILLGKKTNPYPYIKACDIYVQPSRYEGKAVTVREAQILGKPVLITNFPTAKSQVVDGFDGLITEQGIDGIVKGIKKLLKDKELKEQLVKNTKASNYGNQSEIEKLYELIEM